MFRVDKAFECVNKQNHMMLSRLYYIYMGVQLDDTGFGGFVEVLV